MATIRGATAGEYVMQAPTAATPLLKALRATEQEIRMECEALFHAEKAVALKRDVEWHLPAATSRKAVILYVLAGYDPMPSLLFLRRYGNRRGWSVLSDMDGERIVESEFLNYNAEELHAMIDPSVVPLECDRVLQEHSVVQWGRDVNRRGVLPTTKQL